MTAALRTIETEGDRLERLAREAMMEFSEAARECIDEQERARLRLWVALFDDVLFEAGALNARSKSKDPPPPL